MKRILLIIIFLSWTSTCLAGTYYSANDTSSTNWSAAQNISTPCTIATAMSSVAAGDTVYFRGGTYMCPVTGGSGYTPAFKPSNNGTSGNPIIFEAYLDEVPFIDNSNNSGAANTVAGFGVYNTDYCIWDGFHTKVVPDASSLAKGVIFFGSNGSILKNCDIEGYTNGNSNNDIIRVENSSYCTIQNNKLYSSQGSNINSVAAKLYYSHHIKIHNNDVYDCDNGLFDKHGGRNNEFYLNHIWNCPMGVYLDVVDAPEYTTVVYQNIFRNTGTGGGFSVQFALDASSGNNGTSAAPHFHVYNNVFYNSCGITEKVTVYSNTHIYNNIHYTNADALRLYTGASEYVDKNCYYDVTRWRKDTYEAGAADYSTLGDWQAGMGFDTNSVTSNPSFVSVGGTDPEDYKLQGGSPALTLGVDRQDYDSDGNTTETIPAGAYITGSETIGYSAPGNDGSEPSAGSVMSGITLSGCTF